MGGTNGMTDTSMSNTVLEKGLMQSGYGKSPMGKSAQASPERQQACLHLKESSFRLGQNNIKAHRNEDTGHLIH